MSTKLIFNHRSTNKRHMLFTMCSMAGVERDKTIAEKLRYISNDHTQNYYFLKGEQKNA